MIRLEIPGILPNLNDYIKAERMNRQRGAMLKRETERKVIGQIKRQLRNCKITRPVIMKYFWYEPNRRRDKDNISSFGRKVIQDALVQTGVIKNDGWGYITGFSDEFFVDKNKPRIEIEIWETAEVGKDDRREHATI